MRLHGRFFLGDPLLDLQTSIGAGQLQTLFLFARAPVEIRPRPQQIRAQFADRLTRQFHRFGIGRGGGVVFLEDLEHHESRRGIGGGLHF